MTVHTEVKLERSLELKRRLMVAVERAAVAGESYTVVACVPQRLPGEDIAQVMDVCSQHVNGIVRDDDIVGLMDNETLVVGLRETGTVAARVFAYRLQGDLRLSSRPIRNTVWETAYATMPQDGDSAKDLTLAAIEGAKNRRRRLGNQPMAYR